MRRCRSAEPGLDEAQLQARVATSLQSKGVKTRQMKHAKLSSAHAKLVCSASSLSEARERLSSVPAPAAGPRPLLKTRKSAPARGRRRGGGGACDGVEDLCEGMAEVDELLDEGPCTAETVVETVEEAVSAEQVSRMWARGKVKGKW